jgi:hypothetical protein
MGAAAWAGLIGSSAALESADEAIKAVNNRESLCTKNLLF